MPPPDRLKELPSELLLRVLEYLPPSALGSFLRTSKHYNHFIDHAYQDHLYRLNTDHPPSCNLFSFIESLVTYDEYYKGVATWKELCRRRTLLQFNWSERSPLTRQDVFQPGPDNLSQMHRVWRFRPDFNRRFIISTSLQGGVLVSDMDTKKTLWQLGRDNVRPYAHLEYSDGVACWDLDAKNIEVWKASDKDRGHFTKVAILPHDYMTRGFQLIYPTLCVVSSEGLGFVWDLSQPEQPVCQTVLEIEEDAVGHLDQNMDDTIMYSLGRKGYHLHSKSAGNLLGILEPKHARGSIYHIPFVDDPRTRPVGHGDWASDRVMQQKIHPGSQIQARYDSSLQDDEWGAGMISENVMIGISREGRLFLCTDWRGAIKSSRRLAETSGILELNTTRSHFDLGGWLSIKNGRALFEVGSMIYILHIKVDTVPFRNRDEWLVHSIFNSPIPRVQLPISFMGVYDDCIMSTYGIARRIRGFPHRMDMLGLREETPYTVTSGIRILRYSPEFDGTYGPSSWNPRCTHADEVDDIEKDPYHAIKPLRVNDYDVFDHVAELQEQRRQQLGQLGLEIPH